MSYARSTLISDLQELGFRYSHSTRQRGDWFKDAYGHEIKVMPSPSPRAIVGILRQAQKLTGSTAPTNKRNTAKIEARRKSKREQDRRAIETANRRRTASVALRTQMISGYRFTQSQIQQVERFIELRDREIRELRAMMEAPTTSDQRGTRRARHTSGQRTTLTSVS